MFNLLRRDILIGIGIGFIMSGILVSVLGVGQPTDEQIKARAAQLGMVQTVSSLKGEPQSSQDDKTPPSADQHAASSQQGQADSSQKEPAKSSQQAQSDPSKQEQSEPLQQGQSQNAAAEKPQIKAASSQTETGQTVTLEIKPGMGSETIARILENRGVVKDRSAFYKLVTAHRAHSSFRTGVFRLPAGGDQVEILKILTGR